eukprot:4085387-Prymnesium_polylepis.1
MPSHPRLRLVATGPVTLTGQSRVSATASTGGASAKAPKRRDMKTSSRSGCVRYPPQGAGTRLSGACSHSEPSQISLLFCVERCNTNIKLTLTLNPQKIHIFGGSFVRHTCHPPKNACAPASLKKGTPDS